MKNAIKKIVSVAMAFTLLGTGMAITKIIAPQFDNSITASAASVNSTTCKHSTATRKTGQKTIYGVMYGNSFYGVKGPVAVDLYYEVYCPKCGQVFSRYTNRIYL